jgi:hypothetical protein
MMCWIDRRPQWAVSSSPLMVVLTGIVEGEALRKPGSSELLARNREPLLREV